MSNVLICFCRDSLLTDPLEYFSILINNLFFAQLFFIIYLLGAFIDEISKLIN